MNVTRDTLGAVTAQASASIDLSKGALYAQTFSLFGVAMWVADGDPERVSAGLSDDELGDLAKRALGRSRKLATPPDSDATKHWMESVARIAGRRTYRDFVRSVHEVSLDLRDTSITVAASRRSRTRDGAGFEGIGTPAVLDAPTDEELGAAIRAAFEQCEPKGSLQA